MRSKQGSSTRAGKWLIYNWNEQVAGTIQINMYFSEGIEKEPKYNKCAVSKEVQQEPENE